MLVAGLSGGKDSTAMVLELARRGETGTLLFNVVGGELPDLLEFVKKIAEMAGWPLVCTSAGYSLHERIRFYAMLPSNHARWCTRELKIEPTIAYLQEHPGSTLAVGLRADEEKRAGLYGPYADYRYPLREWGWGISEVRAVIEKHGLIMPERGGNCPLCYGQRLSEWWLLWKRYPDIWALGKQLEQETGHTFRNPSRDTWPASMAGLEEMFVAGHMPRDVMPLPLFGTYEVKGDMCRVCQL